MEFNTLKLREENGAMFVTLGNPPINLMNIQMVTELMQLTGMLMQRPDLKVVVLDSADPDFWIAHFDLNDLVSSASDPSNASKYDDINVIQSLSLGWQALPQITIGKVNGRCRGAGLEFLLGLTMRFASVDSKFCSPEASGGFLATGGGTTRMMVSAGPARAMEFLLSARDFTGVEAEKYGIVNRALPEDELDSYVDDLVARIAQRSTPVISMHKEVMQATLATFVEPVFDGFAAENACFRRALQSDEFKQAVESMLKLGQAREVELDLPDTLARFGGGT